MLRSPFLFLVVVACDGATSPDAGGWPDDTNPGVTDTDRPGGTDGPGDGVTDPSGIDTIALSGTRLRRRVAKGADGSEQFLGFWDEQLDVACFVQRSTDGTFRCLPVVDSYGASDVAFGSVYHSDSDCTERVVAVRGCLGTPTWTYTSEPLDCFAYAIRVSKPTGTYTGDLFVKSGSTCVANGATSGSGFTEYTFHRVRDVDPSTFVEMTITVD